MVQGELKKLISIGSRLIRLRVWKNVTSNGRGLMLAELKGRDFQFTGPLRLQCCDYLRGNDRLIAKHLYLVILRCFYYLKIFLQLLKIDGYPRIWA